MEYIALLEQMESEFHWATEIGWPPAKSAVLVAAQAGLRRAGLNLFSALGERKTKVSHKFVWNQNTFVKIIHLQMFTQCSKRN